MTGPQRHTALLSGAGKSYLGLRALRLRAAHSEQLRHSHQVGQRPRAHFLHDVAAMNLDGDLGEPDLGLPPVCSSVRRRPGPCTSRSRALNDANEPADPPGILSSSRLCRSRPIAVDNGVQHVLVAKRLGQEVDRSGLHGPHRHRDVAVAGHEDDRDVDIRRWPIRSESRGRSAPAAGCRGPGSSEPPAACAAGTPVPSRTTPPCKPTERKRLLSALRTDASSSTTNTTGCNSGASLVIRHETRRSASDGKIRPLRHVRHSSKVNDVIGHDPLGTADRAARSGSTSVTTQPPATTAE